MTTPATGPAADDAPERVATCATCAAVLLPLGARHGLRWVCPRCPLTTPADAEVLVARWRSWLADHGVPLAAPPFASPRAWWAPAARTLLVVTAVPDARMITGAVRRGVEHGWDVVWLGDRPEEMYVLLDSHLERHPRPQRWRRAQGDEFLLPDATALAGHCTRCGVFQWHTHWGWWMCRACGHADGDMTLEVDTLHAPGDTGTDGRPRCVTCRAAWESAVPTLDT